MLQLPADSDLVAEELDNSSILDGWEKIPFETDEPYEPESPLADEDTVQEGPKIFDPWKTEPAWVNCALTAASKRQRVLRPKLPWENPALSQVFTTADKWQGTFLAQCSDVFLPTSIGGEDVLRSTVINDKQSSNLATLFEPPVLKVNLRRVRHELPDEDIRRVAICKIRDIVLQDPLATQLGSSVVGLAKGETFSTLAEQSIRDCFRMKASGTLQKRASSLWRLAKLLRAQGVLNPLRLSEEQLYVALCELRTNGAGATAAQHMIEALFFLDATAKLTLVDIRAVVSGQCRGVAKDMYLMKNPLEQKQPLLLRQVRYLEQLFHTVPNTMKCILGQLLFCIHACCRWKDSQRLRAISIESGHGETLIHAEALMSKTTLSAESRTRFLPYIAMGTGVSGADWGSGWLEARKAELLDCGDGDFILPSFSERTVQWTGNPMSASEATYWLREFLEETLDSGEALRYGSHSCKTTVLTWAGRCVQIQFTPTERRLLGHHLEANMKSILTYSRESYLTLYSRVLQMFRLMRDGSFDPDLPAIQRVVQLSEEPHPSHGTEVVADSDVQPVESDSDSSVASECGDLGIEMPPDVRESAELTSLFPDFPGVPESSLMVHRVSGLIHAMNEDGFLMCGRRPSLHFKVYSQVTSDRSLCEGCSQCKKAFAARGAA